MLIFSLAKVILVRALSSASHWRPEPIYLSALRRLKIQTSPLIHDLRFLVIIFTAADVKWIRRRRNSLHEPIFHPKSRFKQVSWWYFHRQRRHQVQPSSMHTDGWSWWRYPSGEKILKTPSYQKDAECMSKISRCFTFAADNANKARMQLSK